MQRIRSRGGAWGVAGRFSGKLLDSKLEAAIAYWNRPGSDGINGSVSALHASGLNLTLGAGQVVLGTGPKAFKLPLMPGPLASWSVNIPSDPSFAGITIYSQGIHLLGVSPFALSNAQDLFIGY